MKLSISNIAWGMENEQKAYSLIKDYGFTGLEIAPTRIFPNDPYIRLNEAKNWAKNLYYVYGFSVPSMQSSWFGKTERIFASEEERDNLLQYTKLAIDFAQAVDCKNLVFGCPKNRTIPENMEQAEAYDIAVKFFKKIGDYAVLHNTVIGMEANPTIYNTNFINTTTSALELISAVNSEGFRLNLDVGTMIYNNESLEIFHNKTHLINHVHISEPYLKPIEKRPIHANLAKMLSNYDYDGYISIEMGKTVDFNILESSLKYINFTFNSSKSTTKTYFDYS